jgi:hypothetical protein
MDQVSRPLQIGLILVLGFAGLWFVALRPKAGTGDSAPAPTPAPAQQTPASSDGAAVPKKSPIPGGLGRAVDKATATKAQGDTAASTQDAQGAQADATAKAPPQNTTDTPVQTPPASPPVSATPPKPIAAGTNVAHSGTLAVGAITVGIHSAIGAKGEITVAGVKTAGRPAHKASHGGRPGFATPAKVRTALAKRHVVVLLFYSARSSDDRQIRRELAAVNRRHGRVNVWAVSVRGLPRFKNVLQNVQVLESPTVVVLSKRAPYTFPGYTDHAQINQAAAVALRAKKA